MDKQLRKMNSQQIALYKRIEAFSFDQPDTQLSFSKRLARYNGWSLIYTQRVIEEYKKFTFLAVVAEHPVTPSDQVDQAWHLHLSYTRSYWQEFCPKVLQTPLHHNPTRGGLSEQLKFDDWYSRTLESYKQFFDQIPPADIWPDPKHRFGRDLHFIRVNTHQNWVVPKLSLSCLPKVQLRQVVILSLVLTLASAVTGCQRISIIPNPLNFTGSEFLTFYFQLSIVAVFLASCLRAYLRLPDGNLVKRTVSLDAYEAAYLAKGKNHVVDTAIASLVQKGRVTAQQERRILTLKGSVEELSHPVEQAVANAIASDGRIDRVRSGLTQAIAIDVIRDQLRQLDLLVSRNQSSKAQTYPALLIACLLGLGITKILVGISRGKPVGYLLMMCIVVAIIGLGFWLTPAHRSRYGDRVLQDLRTRVRSTVVSHTDPHLPLAFALFGMAILPNDMFADLKKLFIIDGGGGGNGGGGGGGDGGGGGGCGGCGGCGG